MNVRLLLRVVIPHPSLKLSLDDSHAHWLCINLLSSAVMLVLCSASAVPWKTSLAYCVDCKSRTELLAG